jgi:hypothetical protein
LIPILRAKAAHPPLGKNQMNNFPYYMLKYVILYPAHEPKLSFQEDNNASWCILTNAG